MKSFQQFVTEAYDKELAGQATRAPGEGGRVNVSRKKDRSDMPSRYSKGNAKARVKAVGGKKTTPSSSYKGRKDIGTNKPRSSVEQQPTRERGTAGLSPREAQRKAAKERRAAKAGAKTPTRTELLSKKTKTVDPNYKPVKASGLTTKERKSLYKKGERTLRDIRLKNLGKKSEKELKHKVTSK